MNNPILLEIAQTAVTEAIRHGALYADVRLEFSEQEDLIVENSRVRRSSRFEERGLGVRVLANGAWGFSAVSEPNRHDSAVAARRAVAEAKAAAILQVRPLSLVHESPHCGIYRTKIERDPISVPLEEKLDLLFEIDKVFAANNRVIYGQTRFRAVRRHKLFLSSEGSEIAQDLHFTSLDCTVGARDDQTTQFLSFPYFSGISPKSQGWEALQPEELTEQAQSCAQDAVEQLSGDECPTATDSIILGGPAMAALLLDICAPNMELDRVLGRHRSPGSASYLSPDKLGVHEFGSDKISLHCDASLAGAAGSFGYDDEGVEAQRVDLVEEGRFCGYLSNRETARELGLTRASGTMRSSSWRSPPVIRATNLVLEPGKNGDLESLIADTKSGVYIEDITRTSHDSNSQGFLAFGGRAWRIKDGKLSGRVKNPSFRARTSQFWRNCDALCARDDWAVYGNVSGGKGLPDQMIEQSAACAPGRFVDVEIGVSNPQVPLISAMDDSIFVSQSDESSPSRNAAATVPSPPPSELDDDIEPTVKPGGAKTETEE